MRDAASISIKSINRPSLTALHVGHTSHGVEVTPISQFKHFAKIRAMVVLPTPRVPVNKYAWCKRPRSKALVSARDTWFCPTNSLKLRGRYLRAST